MLKNDAIKKLQRFYRVKKETLSTDNILKVSVRKHTIKVSMAQMCNNPDWVDTFKIINNRLKLVKTARNQGDQFEPMFLAEY